MTKPSHEVLCGRCKVPVEVLTDTDPQMVRCPDCGVTDTVDNALREAGEHATKVMERGLGKAFANAARGSKFVKLTSKPIPHRSYKFVTNLEL